MTNIRQKIFKNRFFEPVDIAILVYFRIIFGAIMFVEVLRYFSNDWIGRYWIDPTFHFTYYGFDWVQPWPGDGMYYHFIALGILSIFITIGFKYRISTSLFFLGFAYIFLIEEARYLNHFYLIILISFLLIFVPAHKSLSIDAWRNQKKQTDYVPFWTLWILRFQIGIVYFFGGIAKLNGDWLNGGPMHIWLSRKTDFPIIGTYFTEEWMVHLFSYSALLLDLLAVPFLLWKKTRYVTYGIIVIFHILNSQLFSIGIFPWFMIFATLIFFDPSWPRFLIRRHSKKSQTKQYEHTSSLTKNQKVIVALLMIFVLVQVTVPLRHFAYPGNVSWTEEGDLFSWHMKLDVKKSSKIVFYATDTATGETKQINPLLDLNQSQLTIMSQRPDKIIQYVHYIADELHKQGYYDEVEIRVESWVSLNGREFQLQIDPNVDLVKQPQSLLPKSWITSLKE